MESIETPSVATPTAERERTAADISTLATEVERRDPAVAVLLRRLAEALRQRKLDEVRGYATVIDAHAIAELLLGHRSPIWGLVEVARNVLVFAPIAVTWYGLSTASLAYGKLLSARPELVTRPFLLLWQEGFEGAPPVAPLQLNFSTLALIDASLIGLLIVLSFIIHFRADVRDAATRTRVLLKDSEIRGLLGHATSLASMSLGERASDEMLDQMVAEERRIFERAMEREQHLVELEATIAELREAARDLGRAAEIIAEARRRPEPVAERR